MEVAARSGSAESGAENARASGPGSAQQDSEQQDSAQPNSARQDSTEQPVQPGRIRGPFATRIGAYVALTKPRIIELLLITTIPALFAAQREVPPLTLVLATLVGGALAAVAFRFLNPDDVTGPIVPAGIPGVTAKQTVPTSRRRSS